MMKLLNICNAWKRHVPYLRPCYSVSPASSPERIAFLRHRRVSMICHSAKEVKVVNDKSLTVIDSARRGCIGRSNEYIVRSVKQLQRLTGPGLVLFPTPLIWIHTTISSEALENTRQMFEYVWANKHILNGMVIDISNFSNPIIRPSIYSYKIAMDYVFRNMIHPFQNEYNIVTPAIMIDGRDIITHEDHLFELHDYALSKCRYVWEKTVFRPNIHLIVDRLFDIE